MSVHVDDDPLRERVRAELEDVSQGTHSEGIQHFADVWWWVVGEERGVSFIATDERLPENPTDLPARAIWASDESVVRVQR